VAARLKPFKYSSLEAQTAVSVQTPPALKGLPSAATPRSPAVSYRTANRSSLFNSKNNSMRVHNPRGCDLGRLAGYPPDMHLMMRIEPAIPALRCCKPRESIPYPWKARLSPSRSMRDAIRPLGKRSYSSHGGRSSALCNATDL
jgi:hypothetical protein